MSFKQRKHLHEPHPFDQGFDPDFVGGVDLDFLQGGGSDEPVIDFFGGFDTGQRQEGTADEREFISESRQEFAGQRNRLRNPDARTSYQSRRGRPKGRRGQADQRILKGDLSGSDIRTPSKNIDRRLEHRILKEKARLRAGGTPKNAAQRDRFDFNDNSLVGLGYGNL